MTTYRLLVSDLDGTLLQPDRTLGASTVLALRRAQVAGKRLLIATGRPPRFVRPLLHEHGLDIPFASYNGSAIWDGPEAASPLWEQHIAAETAHTLVAALRERDSSLNLRCESGDHNYADYIDAGIAERVRLGITQPPTVGPLEQVIASGRGVAKLLVSVGLAQIAEMIAYVESLGLAVYVTTSGEGWLEVMAAGTDKGRAAAWWAAHCDIPAAQVIACGDHLNDLPLLRWAGLGVAVANAVPEVLAAADHLAASNAEQGVAGVIERFLLAE